jgi:hypothetical protein
MREIIISEIGLCRSCQVNLNYGSEYWGTCKLIKMTDNDVLSPIDNKLKDIFPFINAGQIIIVDCENYKS